RLFLCLTLRCSTERTHRPATLNQSPARLTGASQLITASWAVDPFVFGYVVTGWADGDVVELLGEVFLFDPALLLLVQRLAWAQEHVDHNTRDEKEHYDQRRKHLHHWVPRAQHRITVCPDHQREPERN